jgi:hypothetical protein
MKDDFSRYETMKAAGSSPEDLYREAVRSGVDPITRIRMIRTVCDLSLREAKEVLVRAEGLAESLDEHQAKLAENLVRPDGRVEVFEPYPDNVTEKLAR